MCLLFSAPPAAACFKANPEIDYTIFRESDLILRAWVVAYEKRPAGQNAVFRFEVLKTLSGEIAAREVKAEWRNSTFGEPDTWIEPKEVIVGLKAEIGRNGLATISVVQQPCGPVSILEYSWQNLARVMQGIGNQK
ncbi:hypothetical protein [Emcibacter sp. SYSU 3D8]|uniref:hypothetical protein n=1 Tax=Emcibacter sp. SYSU 3D8 TaxID=3133969 RepID=UPI0031FE8CA6